MLDPQARPVALVGKKHPALRTPATLIDHGGPEVRALASRMWATLRRSQGLAIAACQIGEPISLVVTASGHAFVNPRYKADSNGLVTEPEGCLSLPGRWFAVPRPKRITLTAIDVTNPTIDQVVTSPFEGLQARCWAHELTHLDGILICDQWPELRGAATRSSPLRLPKTEMRDSEPNPT